RQPRSTLFPYMTLFRSQPNFDQAELTVTADGEGAELDLDLDRFKQIVANLLSNSIRYTEAGGQVHIHTTQDDKEWTLYVDDSPRSEEHTSELQSRENLV